jgi:hypothetical protein
MQKLVDKIQLFVGQDQIICSNIPEPDYRNHLVTCNKSLSTSKNGVGRHISRACLPRWAVVGITSLSKNKEFKFNQVYYIRKHLLIHNLLAKKKKNS